MFGRVCSKGCRREWCNPDILTLTLNQARTEIIRVLKETFRIKPDTLNNVHGIFIDLYMFEKYNVWNILHIGDKYLTK
jgi:hypothetical protein